MTKGWRRQPPKISSTCFGGSLGQNSSIYFCLLAEVKLNTTIYVKCGFKEYLVSIFFHVEITVLLKQLELLFNLEILLLKTNYLWGNPWKYQMLTARSLTQSNPGLDLYFSDFKATSKYLCYHILGQIKWITVELWKSISGWYKAMSANVIIHEFRTVD